MDRAKPYLQVAAAVSAVLLVGLFVAYRAGAFDRPTAPPVEPQAGETPNSPEGQPPASYLSGSKSTFVFPAGQVAPPPEPVLTQIPPGSKPTFMGGSKSITVLDTKTGVLPAVQPANSPEPPKPKN